MRIIDRYSDEELIERLENMTTFQGFIEDLGYKTGRSANIRRVVIKRLEDIGVNYKDYLKTKTQLGALQRIPDEVFYSRGKYRGSKVAERLKKDKKFPYECIICKNVGLWNGIELTLQVDHIDGDNTNNELSNLRWLCPNCHTQTDTYGNKLNKKEYEDREVTKKKRIETRKTKKIKICSNCSIEFSNDNKYFCSMKCSSESRMKEPPIEKDELIRRLKEESFTSVGKSFNLSDNAVRKWCRKYGISDKASYYNKD